MKIVVLAGGNDGCSGSTLWNHHAGKRRIDISFRELDRGGFGCLVIGNVNVLFVSYIKNVR